MKLTEIISTACHDKTVRRFIIVGIVNTLIGLSIAYICHNVFDIPYWPSVAAEYIIGSTVSYFLNKHYTFEFKEKGHGSVIRFVLNIVVCWLIAYAVAKPLVSWVCSPLSERWKTNIAFLVGEGLFFVLNYLGQRFFAFNKKTAGENQDKIPTQDA